MIVPLTGQLWGLNKKWIQSRGPQPWSYCHLVQVLPCCGGCPIGCPIIGCVTASLASTHDASEHRGDAESAKDCDLLSWLWWCLWAWPVRYCIPGTHAGLAHSRCLESTARGWGPLCPAGWTSLKPLLQKEQPQNHVTLEKGQFHGILSLSLSLFFSLSLSTVVSAGLRQSWRQNDRESKSRCPSLRLLSAWFHAARGLAADRSLNLMKNVSCHPG